MSTKVSVNTYTYSVTYVTQQVLRSLKDIIRQSGLGLDKLLGEWESIELAVSTWLGSKHLQKVTLEIFNPTNNTLVVRWDIDVEYSYASGDDGSLWTDPDSIKNAIAKAGVVASSCRYQFKVLAPNGPKVQGWSPGTYRSTEGFSKHSVGTTIGAGALATSTTYWRKS